MFYLEYISFNSFICYSKSFLRKLKTKRNALQYLKNSKLEKMEDTGFSSIVIKLGIHLGHPLLISLNFFYHRSPIFKSIIFLT